MTSSEIRNVIGCNMAFRRELLCRVGTFGTDLGRVGEGVSGTAEETEVSLRIKKADEGSIIVFQPDARIRHKVPGSRLTLKYLLARSWDEGFNKARMKRLSVHRDGLLTESKYLRYLVFDSIPNRLARFFKVTSLAQAGAMLASIMATGAGFAWGIVVGRRHARLE